MSFLLGILVGATILSGESNPGKALETLNRIPLRCLSLAESKLDEYRECRRNTMFHELKAEERCMGTWGRDKECENNLVNKNIGWEIETLQKFAAAGREHNR